MSNSDMKAEKATTENENIENNSPLLDTVLERDDFVSPSEAENEDFEDDIEESESQDLDLQGFDDDQDLEDIEDLDEEEAENEDNIAIDDKLSGLGADFIVGMVDKILPQISHSISAFDTKENLILEQQGKLLPGTADKLEEVNKKNLEELKSTVSIATPFLKEPLDKLIVKKGGEIKPETMLILVSVGLMLYLGFQTFKTRKTNQEAIAQLIALHAPKEEEKEEIIDMEAKPVEEVKIEKDSQKEEIEDTKES